MLVISFLSKNLSNKAVQTEKFMCFKHEEKLRESANLYT